MSDEEHEALQANLGEAVGDFGVRFILDGCQQGVMWSGEVCHRCDPFNYKAVTERGRLLPSRLLG